MDHIPMILAVSGVLFVLVYWCWSSLLSADATGPGSSDCKDAGEATEELHELHGPAPFYTEPESKPLAR